MKILLFDDYSYLLGQGFSFFFLIFFYFKINYFSWLTSSKINKSGEIKLKKYKVFKKIAIFSYFRWLLVVYLILWFFFWLFRGFQKNLIFGKYKLANFTILISLTLISLSIFLFFLIKNISKINMLTNIEFYFSNSLLGVIACLIYWSNDLFILFLHLELLTFLFFYTIASSKFWIKQKSGKHLDNFKNFKKQINMYINMLFYYYWINFFGSTLLVYSFINIYANWGTLNLNLLETLYLNDKNFNQWDVEIFSWMPFFLGFLIKIGIAPFHFFKLEVYRGSTIFILFFYSIYFLTVYSTIFIIINLYYFSHIFLLWANVWYVIIVGAGLLLVLTIFNVNYVKTFFAISTVINVYLWIFCLTTQLI